MSKPIFIYKISSNYTRCEVWHGSRTFHNRIGASTLAPNKGLKRKDRYDMIVKWLFERFGFPGPSYRPTKAEERRSQCQKS